MYVLRKITIFAPNWLAVLGSLIRFLTVNKMILHTGRIYALAFAALMFILVSCEADKPSHSLAGNGKGKVMLSLYSDIEIKSEAVPISDVDDYNFRFVGVDGYATSDYYRYGDVVWPMEWYFGLFRLQAESCTEEEAEVGYGQLRYEGISLPFAVINDQMATASVICDIANFRVDVNFNDKMFLSYKDFKLTVESVLAPVYELDEDGNMTLVRDEQLMRTLDFTTVDKTGFYNLHHDPMILRYDLYVMLDGASEFLPEPKASGYVTVKDSTVPLTVNAGDYITLNVNYIGEVQPSAGIKFIVEGERKGIGNEVEIGDYTQDGVTEDN